MNVMMAMLRTYCPEKPQLDGDVQASIGLRVHRRGVTITVNSARAGTWWLLPEATAESLGRVLADVTPTKQIAYMTIG